MDPFGYPRKMQAMLDAYDLMLPELFEMWQGKENYLSELVAESIHTPWWRFLYRCRLDKAIRGGRQEAADALNKFLAMLNESGQGWTVYF